MPTTTNAGDWLAIGPGGRELLERRAQVLHDLLGVVLHALDKTDPYEGLNAMATMAFDQGRVVHLTLSAWPSLGRNSGWDVRYSWDFPCAWPSA
jgi:hypothetical protein